jgi:hypothetical protein
MVCDVLDQCTVYLDVRDPNRFFLAQQCGLQRCASPLFRNLVRGEAIAAQDEDLASCTSEALPNQRSVSTMAANNAKMHRVAPSD